LFKRPKMSWGERGFTLVELLVVVAIVAILAAVLIPQLLPYTQNARVSQAMGDLASMKSVIESYAANEGKGQYPKAGTPSTWNGGALTSGMDVSVVLQSKGINWTGANGGMMDPWERPYRYTVFTDTNGNIWGYKIESAGPNKKPGDSDDIYVTNRERVTQGQPPQTITGLNPGASETSNGSTY